MCTYVGGARAVERGMRSGPHRVRTGRPHTAWKFQVYFGLFSDREGFPTLSQEPATTIPGLRGWRDIVRWDARSMGRLMHP
eukprot:8379168-Pyramimonas_sp.AAC.1